MPQEVGCPQCGLPDAKGGGPIFTQCSQWNVGLAWGMAAVPLPRGETPQPLPRQDAALATILQCPPALQCPTCQHQQMTKGHPGAAEILPGQTT